MKSTQENTNAHSHLTLEERRVILTGITNGSTKAAIAETIGKEKSTIGKEIKGTSKNQSASDAQSDFSSDGAEMTPEYWRIPRNFRAIWRKRCKQMRR